LVETVIAALVLVENGDERIVMFWGGL